MAVFGLLLGAVFFWLALRKVDTGQLKQAFSQIDFRLVGYAIVSYWLGMALRIVRWSTLLNQMIHAERILVAETLIVGYAVNNVLPARLGEIFRADYAKRRFGISRSSVLGTIVMERMFDLVAILGCLGAGLILVDVADDAKDRIAIFEIIALNSALVVGVVIIGIYFLRAGAPRNLRLPATAERMLIDLGKGVQTMTSRSLVLVGASSLTIWTFEVAALWLIFEAVGVDLGASQALLIMGAASLSTLVPTAPGYLGTYQLVFVLAMGLFGLPEMYGIIASTGIQVALFGTVTLVGISLLVTRALAAMGNGTARD
jgi:uncharacterized protein (TIRG00374 family)